MEILPAIDLKNGQCVRLFQGDYSTAHVVHGDPLAVAQSYREAGASLIHVVDLDGARDGTRRNAELVSQIVRAAAPVAVELGGGLRALADLEAAGALGVRRFILGSAAVEDPAFVRAACECFGGGRVAVGIDARDGFVKTQGWHQDTGLDYIAFARQMTALGVQTLIFTDIDTDGAMQGPHWARTEALRRAVDCHLVLSGGVSSLDDIARLRDMGIDSVIIGKALYVGAITLEQAIACARR